MSPRIADQSDSVGKTKDSNPASIDPTSKSGSSSDAPLTILTVDGPVGSGKTTSAINYITRAVALGRKILLVQPTKDLIDQTAANLRKKDKPTKVTIIHGDDGGGGAIIRIVKHFEQASEGGEILLITHAAFERLRYVPGRTKWELICDEALQINYFRECQFAENPSSVLDLFDSQPFDDEYSSLKVRNTTHVQSVAANKNNDETWSLLKELASKLLSPSVQMYTQTKQELNFRAGSVTKINIFGLLEPGMFSGFRSATIMSACLRETLHYKYWQKCGVKFVEHKFIKPSFTRHPNGEHLDIYYALDGNWSKHLRDQGVGNEPSKTVFSSVVLAAEKVIGDAPFVWIANNDVKESPFKSKNCDRLRGVPHGSNKYRNYNNAIVLSAANPTPADYKFLERVASISPDEVKDGIYRQLVYQACGRISLRDLDNTELKSVVVMDKATAIWLQDLFVESRVHKLDCEFVEPIPGKVGRKRKHTNGAERSRAYRERKKNKTADRIRESDRESN